MDMPEIPTLVFTLIISILFSYFCLKLAKVSFIETLPWFLLNLHKFHKITVDVLERDNGTYHYKRNWFGVGDFVVTVDTANIQYISNTNFANYPKGDEHRKMFDVLGYAVFNSDDDDWKFYRRVVQASLKSRNFFNHSMETAHEKLERALVPLLKHVSEQNDNIVDMQDVFQRFALDVVLKSATGRDPETLSVDFPNVPFLSAVADFERGIVYRIALPKFLWKLQVWAGVGPESKLAHARKVISTYISSIVSKNKRQDAVTRSENNRIEDGNESADVLTLLAKEIDKTPQKGNTRLIYDELFQDMILQMLIAGRDTTSAAMSWFIWLVAKHPKVEEKIRQELIANITLTGEKAGEWRVFTPAETSKLVYLHATINESLRLYPPSPFQFKKPIVPDILPSGHVVNPKTNILIPLYASARMKSLWGENCAEFDPERWITEKGSIKHEPSNKFLVFYTGPRSCLGKDIAMGEMKTIAATLVHNFRFRLVEGHQVYPELSMFLNLKHGLKVQVYNRWTSEQQPEKA